MEILNNALDSVYYALPLILLIAFAPRILRGVIKFLDWNDNNKKK